MHAVASGLSQHLLRPLREQLSLVPRHLVPLRLFPCSVVSPLLAPRPSRQQWCRVRRVLRHAPMVAWHVLVLCRSLRRPLLSTSSHPIHRHFYLHLLNLGCPLRCLRPPWNPRSCQNSSPLCQFTAQSSHPLRQFIAPVSLPRRVVRLPLKLPTGPYL